MLERAAEWAAAASLAAAVAYAAVRLGSPVTLTAVAALAVLLGGVRIVGGIGSAQPIFALPDFEPAPLPEADRPEELILTDADRLDAVSADELLLDEVLAKLEDSSRVVRLFDRSAMPSPGELKSRIDRHLEGSRPVPPDASQALLDALSQLRLSLR